MDEYSELTGEFVRANRDILGGNLVGVYLHGSAAMGCFNSRTSDLDFIVVIRDALPDNTKRAYMDMVVRLNQQAPAKGIELSIVQEKVCSPFVYPTPFELHFSIAHLDWYQTNPDDYIRKMNGTDKDLAAHFTIIRHRGKTLCGKAICDVFSTVGRDAYVDSIREDIRHAREEIMDNPVYITLNLCRVLAFCRENLILSKPEGGSWGLRNVPGKYARLITGALDEYESNRPAKPDRALADEYAEYMLGQINAAVL